jgi:hypothetical protein
MMVFGTPYNVVGWMRGKGYLLIREERCIFFKPIKLICTNAKRQLNSYPCNDMKYNRICNLIVWLNLVMACFFSRSAFLDNWRGREKFFGKFF